MVWIWFVVGVLALVAAYFAALFFIFRASLNPPRIPIYLSPGAMGCEQESVLIPSPLGDAIPGWFVPPKGAVVAIHLHGYLMNRCELVPTAVWLAQRNIGSLLVDLGGHGNAIRNDTGVGWKERHEVLACCDFVRARLPEAEVILIGSSMGSAAAAFALGERPDSAQGLVLDSSYCALDRAVDGWWSALGRRWLAVLLKPMRVFARPLVGYDPGEVVVAKSLAAALPRTLVLHGDRDRIAHPDEARRNIEALGDRAMVHWFEGCGHSEGRWERPDEYFAALERFLLANGWLSYTSQS